MSRFLNTFVTSLFTNQKINTQMKTRIFLFMLSALLICSACEKASFYDDEEDDVVQKDDTGKGSDTDDGNDEDGDWVGRDNDSDTPYEEKDIVDGNDPDAGDYHTGDYLTVTEFINAQSLPGVYVTGYIVAACAQNKKNAQFTPPFTWSSALLLADDKDETDVEKTIAIELKSGSKIRDINLDDHPENHLKRLRVFGYRTNYLGLKGIKGVGAGNWELLD